MKKERFVHKTLHLNGNKRFELSLLKNTVGILTWFGGAKGKRDGVSSFWINNGIRSASITFREDLTNGIRIDFNYEELTKNIKTLDI